MVLIEELVRKIPMAEKLLEIKGVGIRTVSGFLAEVGDISRFNNPKELQKLAGTNKRRCEDSAEAGGKGISSDRNAFSNRSSFDDV